MFFLAETRSHRAAVLFFGCLQSLLNGTDPMKPLPMRVQITSESEGFTPGPAWWDNHIGESFPLLQYVYGTPMQYQVDISRLVQSGEISDSCCGIGYVPIDKAKLVGFSGRILDREGHLRW